MKKKEREKCEVPVSAMIDVVFLLLVYFIVTSTPTVKEAFVLVNLPGPTSSPSLGVSLDVYVLEDSYQIYGKTVNLEEAERYFETLAQGDLKISVNLKTDPAANHSSLVLMLDRLKKVEINDFNIHTLK
jgi:biopolymer transport protein ExbD